MLGDTNFDNIFYKFSHIELTPQKGYMYLFSDRESISMVTRFLVCQTY
jgi:hypothetical protein